MLNIFVVNNLFSQGINFCCNSNFKSHFFYFYYSYGRLLIISNDNITYVFRKIYLSNVLHKLK